MSTAKKVTLVTADKVEFEVDEAVAMKFGIVKSFLEENSEKIPLPNVYSMVLSLVIEYCKAHLELTDEKAKQFNENFFKSQHNQTLMAMCLAANYLDEKELLDTVEQAIADRMENKSVEYARKFFGIENDFTPEEEEDLRQGNEWAFEGVDDDEQLSEKLWYCNINISI
ncbi:SKP1 component [Corchorus capsularis]|uniref:SKP1-like protein n=1 Tax=Corchorus capsularis TaxID=210143 RepID=A0A1R3H7S8_COCAP|nr:SKP1 component [Corchorus capsularis]